MQPEPYPQQNVWAYIISLLACNQLAMGQYRCITVQEEALVGKQEWGMAQLRDLASNVGMYVFTHPSLRGHRSKEYEKKLLHYMGKPTQELRANSRPGNVPAHTGGPTSVWCTYTIQRPREQISYIHMGLPPIPQLWAHSSLIYALDDCLDRVDCAFGWHCIRQGGIRSFPLPFVEMVERLIF